MKSFEVSYEVRELVESLPEDERSQFLYAIYMYQYNDIKIELPTTASLVFVLLKSKLDCSKMRSKNGSKGGSKKQANRVAKVVAKPVAKVVAKVVANRVAHISDTQEVIENDLFDECLGDMQKKEIKEERKKEEKEENEERSKEDKEVKEEINKEENREVLIKGEQNFEKNILPKKSIPEREQEFVEEAHKYDSEFGAEMIDDFCMWWTESSVGAVKMRFEMEKTWCLHRRLLTWRKNERTNFGRRIETPAPKLEEVDENGNRYYINSSGMKIPIPASAPPRPGAEYFWRNGDTIEDYTVWDWRK